MARSCTLTRTKKVRAAVGEKGGLLLCEKRAPTLVSDAGNSNTEPITDAELPLATAVYKMVRHRQRDERLQPEKGTAAQRPRSCFASHSLFALISIPDPRYTVQPRRLGQ